MPRKYAPKGDQRCAACGRKGHNSRSPLCPASLAKAAGAKWGRAFDRELEARADRLAALASPADAVLLIKEAARAATEMVAS